MTSTTVPPSPVLPRSARREPGASSRRGQARREQRRCEEPRALARYAGWNGRAREVITRPGHAGSVLVVDRDATSLGDRRLVAHLAADEPAENAALVCRRYLQDARGGRPRCRRLTPEDSRTAPFADDEEDLSDASAANEIEPVDRLARSYRLERVQTGMSIPELRWRRYWHQGADEEPRVVSVRDAIAGLEAYEPVRTLTRRALVRHQGDSAVSSTVLRVELVRLQQSPIVLNRGLRQVVLATIERQGLSMSEIAIRCGRVKRDCNGNESGETSWLARRLGMLPEGGREAPTPWIHSDVLALIARHGLGVSPREVELE
jgi:hypothetical protein